MSKAKKSTSTVEKAAKTLDVVDKSSLSKKVSDVEVFGNPELFQLVSKVSSASEKWMKSTKVCNLPKGVLVQVTTQQGDNVAEALEYIPGTHFSKKVGFFGIVN